ncbi:hypothetical protein [Streptomyces lavendofoliae]
MCDDGGRLDAQAPVAPCRQRERDGVEVAPQTMCEAGGPADALVLEAL